MQTSNQETRHREVTLLPSIDRSVPFDLAAAPETSVSLVSSSLESRAVSSVSSDRPRLSLKPYFEDVFHSFPSYDGMHFMLVAEEGRIRADEAEPSSIGKWWFIDVFDWRGIRIAEKHIARSPEIFDVAKQPTTDEVGP